MNVLIVDDHPSNLLLLRAQLEAEGHTVREAPDGVEALAILNREHVDAIISDILMPRLDGYRLCDEVRKSERLYKIPFIVYTATYTSPADEKLCLDLGADRYLRKPVAAQVVLTALREVGNTAARRAPNRSGSLSGSEVMKEYSERLVSKLEEKNVELTRTGEELRAAYDDLRQTQQAVMQQERLRALGQMAGGIAHDINNAISPVTLYTESLLERETSLSERARDYLRIIQRAIDDVAQTVGRMREFYRPRAPQLQLEQVDLNRVIAQVLDLTRARWSDQPQRRGVMIELKNEPAAGLPRIMGAENEIRDALTNLIFNAVDAMPEGGTLGLRTGVVAPLQRPQDESAHHVCVEVSDTGIGMDEPTKRRCLEPFFTTKGERGTGMGLAMVYGMVQRHSAELEIDSVAGKGTTVRLIFPVRIPAFAATVQSAVAPVPARSLRILIIDDDSLLIKSLRDTLESDGHWVTTADGGQAGIDAFVAAQERHEPFQVAITDLGMPYVDGRQVAAAIHDASPTTPIVLLTGWGQRLLAENDVPPHVNRVLNKPPRLHELRAALAEAAAGAVQSR
jgi:signal transduction histidine kinase